ncbi:hypothetical protein ACEUZ9_000968 [Paracoccus litorisediminis]|uniref:hypothetical protein n=1 Tax=Paracoccus litorisediminis TaxID=2006130 RepID=UPI00372FBB01
MLTCTIIAGALFVSDGVDHRQSNFGSVQYVKLVRDWRDKPVGEIELQFYEGYMRFAIPQKWQGLTADGVMNACATAAEGTAVFQPSPALPLPAPAG